jgi:hypothetical protein
MTEPRDIRSALRSMDEAIAGARPSPELDARIEASLSRPFPRVLIGAVVAALAWASVFAWLWRDPEPKAIVESEMALFTPGSCAPESPRVELRLAPGCSVHLDSPELSIVARTSVLLKRTTAGIRVVEGTAGFSVDKRPEGSPVAVFVSGGMIEVIGTRFVIRETGESGEVALEEGRIAFVDLDGSRSRLDPGGVHRWHPHRGGSVFERSQVEPADPETKPEVQTTDRVPPRVPVARPTPTEIPKLEPEELPPAQWSVERTAREVERVTELRARQRYEEAAALIEKLLQAPLEPRAAEVLSFERGELLEHKLRLPEKACAHWGDHRRRFPNGRYRAEVARALAECREQAEPAAARRGE